MTDSRSVGLLLVHSGSVDNRLYPQEIESDEIGIL